MNTKIVWGFDPEKSREYTLPITCYPDPEQPGEFIMPAFYLAVQPPPTALHEVAIAGEADWIIEADYRGEQYYDAASELHVIQQRGIRPAAGWTREKPLALLESRTRALALIDDYHASQVQQLVGNPTQVEKDTWALKLETAQLLIDNIQPLAAGQAFLVGAGFKTSASQQAWAAKVFAKAATYAHIVGLAEKLRSQARQAVEAAGDVAAIDLALTSQREAADQVIAQLKAAS